MKRSLGLMLQELINNKVLVCSFVAWLTAEILKFIVDGRKRGEWKLRNMFSSGGFPSSHTAAVFSLSLATGMNEGFQTALFAVSGVFAMVVMYDATGVRQETGKQGMVLNSLISWLKNEQPDAMVSGEAGMKERVGHSWGEVFAGALWGLFWVVIFFRL